MTGPQPADATDEELVARLSQIASQADPVPPALFAAARAAFGLRELDARVAELVRDSAVDAPVAAVRGLSARMLSFEVAGISVECEITVRGAHRDIIGQLIGGDAGLLEAQVAGSSPPITVPVGEHGRFSVRDLTAGPVRLRCRLADGTTVVTSWTAL